MIEAISFNGFMIGLIATFVLKVLFRSMQLDDAAQGKISSIPIGIFYELVCSCQIFLWIGLIFFLSGKVS